MNKTILILLLLIIISGCSNSNTNIISYIDIEKDLKLNQLYLEMPYEELIKLVGEEQDRDVSNDNEDEIINLFFSDGTEIMMFEGKTYSIAVTSQEYQTPRGLRVGDSVEELEKRYGSPTYEEEGKWSYTDEKDYIHFSVWLKNKKVTKIEINLVM